MLDAYLARKDSCLSQFTVNGMCEASPRIKTSPTCTVPVFLDALLQGLHVDVFKTEICQRLTESLPSNITL